MHTDKELHAIFLADREAYLAAILEDWRERRDAEICGAAPCASSDVAWFRKRGAAGVAPPKILLERLTTPEEKREEVARLCGGGRERWIEGVASTPRATVNGNANSMLGAKIALPIPLCLAHDRKRRVGWVVEAIRSPESLEFKARVVNGNASFPEADYAWDRLVDGRLRDVSVACKDAKFKSHEGRIDVDHVIEEWTWSELSLCELGGANPDAQVLVVRAGENVLRDARAEA